MGRSETTYYVHTGPTHESNRGARVRSAAPLFGHVHGPRSGEFRREPIFDLGSPGRGHATHHAAKTSHVRGDSAGRAVRSRPLEKSTVTPRTGRAGRPNSREAPGPGTAPGQITLEQRGSGSGGHGAEGGAVQRAREPGEASTARPSAVVPRCRKLQLNPSLQSSSRRPLVPRGGGGSDAHRDAGCLLALCAVCTPPCTRTGHAMEMQRAAGPSIGNDPSRPAPANASAGSTRCTSPSCGAKAFERRVGGRTRAAANATT